LVAMTEQTGITVIATKTAEEIGFDGAMILV
jgi:hypothetical protein